MIVFKKKYDELQDKYYDLEKEYNDLLDENFKLEKLAKGDYGDSIEFLLIKWASIMWSKGVKPQAGESVLKTIGVDMQNLIGKLLQRKR